MVAGFQENCSDLLQKLRCSLCCAVSPWFTRVFPDLLYILNTTTQFSVEQSDFFALSKNYRNLTQNCVVAFGVRLQPGEIPAMARVSSDSGDSELRCCTGVYFAAILQQCCDIAAAAQKLLRYCSRGPGSRLSPWWTGPQLQG